MTRLILFAVLLALSVLVSSEAEAYAQAATGKCVTDLDCKSFFDKQNVACKNGYCVSAPPEDYSDYPEGTANQYFGPVLEIQLAPSAFVPSKSPLDFGATAAFLLVVLLSLGYVAQRK